MKVLLISGQNHKGSTYHIARILAEKITADDEISEIFLPRDFSEFCCGCNSCFVKSETACPHYEKLSPITKMIDSSDVIIFASPVYVFHTTGQMKTLLDHYGYRWVVHRPEDKMFKKQAVIVSTAAGSGMKSTCKDIYDSCFFWGIPKIFKYGVAVAAIGWDGVSEKKKRKIECKTDKIAKKILFSKEKIPFSLKTRMLFSVMRFFQKKGGMNTVDVTYWEQKDWTKNIRPWK